MVQHIQNVCAIGDGIVDKKLELRRVAQVHTAAQLAAQVTGGGLEALEQALLIRAVQGADIDPGIAQVAGGVHMGDGQHTLGHPGVLDGAQQGGKLLLDGVIDAGNAVGCHSRSPFVFDEMKRGRAKRPPSGLCVYWGISSMVKASMISPAP